MSFRLVYPNKEAATLYLHTTKKNDSGLAMIKHHCLVALLLQPETRSRSLPAAWLSGQEEMCYN